MPQHKTPHSLFEAFSVLVGPYLLNVFSCVFWRSLFHTFRDFGVLRASKICVFFVNLEHVFVIR